MLTIALCWVGQAGAQVKTTTDPASGARIIVDAARRRHKVMPMRSITQAQRKAAASRMQARFAAAAQNARTVKREVKK
ncbi:MAG: hypothetical protein ACE14L_09680 [Terriglobales bacterium]